MNESEFVQGLIRFVESFVGERETDGENRSSFIDVVNRWTGVPVGSPYCISALLWCIDQYCKENGYQTALTRRASVLGFLHSIPHEFIYEEPEDGDIVCWNFGNGYGHAGIVIDVIDQESMLTVEFNTSDGKGINRDGNGCYERTRSRTGSDSFKVLGFVRIKELVNKTF